MALAGGALVLIRPPQRAHGLDLGFGKGAEQRLDGRVLLELRDLGRLFRAACRADRRLALVTADDHHPATAGPLTELLGDFIREPLWRSVQQAQFEAPGLAADEADVLLEMVLEHGVAALTDELNYVSKGPGSGVVRRGGASVLGASDIFRRLVDGPGRSGIGPR